MIVAALTERSQIRIPSTRSKTSEGYLRVLANVTRAGVSKYKKGELRGVRDNSLPNEIGVYRPMSILESDVTRDSIRLKPVTYGHPRGSMVTPNNYSQLAKGHVGEVSTLQDGHLQVEMFIHDPDLIGRIEEGQMEVSIGTLQTVRMRKESGTFEGEPYHLRIDSPLDINHVGCGRARKRTGW